MANHYLDNNGQIWSHFLIGAITLQDNWNLIALLNKGDHFLDNRGDSNLVTLLDKGNHSLSQPKLDHTFGQGRSFLG
jgi:hypothetical protein